MSVMRPVICMITDRRRFGADWEPPLLERVSAAARAGVHIVQIRESDLDARALTTLVERCMAAVRGTPARVVVNDRLDVALAAGAHGVHLRADSVAASSVRRIVSRPFLVGRSVHSRDEAERATHDDNAVDYLIFGTVFESRSKPDAGAAGPDALAAVAAVTPLPVLAIGGVDVERAARVALTGAAGVAAIGLFADCPVESLQVVVAQAAMAFDTPGGVP
jgi:thiamine-phosphate pyrophosphorylase